MHPKDMIYKWLYNALFIVSTMAKNKNNDFWLDPELDIRKANQSYRIQTY